MTKNKRLMCWQEKKPIKEAVHDTVLPAKYLSAAQIQQKLRKCKCFKLLQLYSYILFFPG